VIITDRTGITNYKRQIAKSPKYRNAVKTEPTAINNGKVLKEQIEEICRTSLQSDQNLRGPHVARQQQLWIDICCGLRQTSAANPPPTLLLFIDGTDRRTDGRTDGHSAVL